MIVVCVQNCYIDRYYEEGKEYEYSGPKSPYLKPIETDQEPASKKVSRKPANQGA